METENLQKKKLIQVDISLLNRNINEINDVIKAIKSGAQILINVGDRNEYYIKGYPVNRDILLLYAESLKKELEKRRKSIKFTSTGAAFEEIDEEDFSVRYTDTYYEDRILEHIYKCTKMGKLEDEIIRQYCISQTNKELSAEKRIKEAERMYDYIKIDKEKPTTFY